MTSVDTIIAILADGPEREAHVRERLARQAEAAEAAGELADRLALLGLIGDPEAAREAIAQRGDLAAIACRVARLVSFDDVRLLPADGGRG